MRSMRRVASATLMAATVIGGLGTAPSARATGDPINGTYVATSVGEWSKTNRAFSDQATVRSRWTITSSCTTAQDCSGQVTSDQGWSAPLVVHDGALWYVRRNLPNWEACPDGSAVTGRSGQDAWPERCLRRKPVARDRDAVQAGPGHVTDHP
jgi:hypothetical protein